MARHVRETVSERAAVVVAIGGAGEAGIDLVSGGNASAAVLVDPDVTALATDETSQQLVREPGFAERLLDFLEPLERHVDDFSTRGTLSDEGINALVEATFGGESQLPERHRELLRSIMTEQLRAALPLDIEAQQRGVLDRPDWISRLAENVERCTVAISPSQRLGDLLNVEGRLRDRVPDIRIAYLTSSPSHLLGHPPEEMSDLIHSILGQV